MASYQDALSILAAEAPVSRTHPMLTRAMIEADDACMESDHISPLLECIWKYSSTYAYPIATSIELAADHRYWLPNGLLADEWISFFVFAPRWLDLAPLEVKSAFEREIIISFGVEPSFAEIMEFDEHLSRQLLEQPVRNDLCSANYHGHLNSMIPYPGVSLATGLSTGWPLTPPLAVDPRMLPQPYATPVGISVQLSPSSAVVVPQILPLGPPSQHAPQRQLMLPPAQPFQHASQGNAQLASASAPGAHPALIPVANVPPFPLQSVPSGAAAFEQNPAAPPIFNQLLQAKGITTVGFRPGSVFRTGNQNAAWSAERIRAFVQIQGRSIHQLPEIAFSEFGDEMTNFRTPASIDMRCCPFETSLEEMFTFFSNTCTLTRETCVRAMRYWTPMDIARYINYAHDTQRAKAFSRSRIGHQFGKAEEWRNQHPGFAPTASLRNVSRDSGHKGHNLVLHDVFLYNMGDGVVRPPTGRGKQMLSRVINHVRTVTGDRNILLSQAATYATRHNITVPALEQMNFANLAVEDQLPSAAMLTTIKADYQKKHNGENP